jgi:hypothetical protein
MSNKPLFGPVLSHAVFPLIALKTAAATPGVVAGNDVDVAQQTTEADRARLRAADENIAAARSALKALGEIESYLRVEAPFDGVVTERNVHPGALVELGDHGIKPFQIEPRQELELHAEHFPNSGRRFFGGVELLFQCRKDGVQQLPSEILLWSGQFDPSSVADHGFDAYRPGRVQSKGSVPTGFFLILDFIFGRRARDETESANRLKQLSSAS